MTIHIYRKGAPSDRALASITMTTNRVTMFSDGRERYDYDGPVLVIGTLPNISVLKMSDINWYWIEED